MPRICSGPAPVFTSSCTAGQQHHGLAGAESRRRSAFLDRALARQGTAPLRRNRWLCCGVRAPVPAPAATVTTGLAPAPARCCADPRQWRGERLGLFRRSAWSFSVAGAASGRPMEAHPTQRPALQNYPECRMIPDAMSSIDRPSMQGPAAMTAFAATRATAASRSRRASRGCAIDAREGSLRGSSARSACSLFHRTTRQVRLTADGERLFERCQRVLADSRRAAVRGPGARGDQQRAAPASPVLYGGATLRLARLGRHQPPALRRRTRSPTCCSRASTSPVRIGPLHDSGAGRAAHRLAAPGVVHPARRTWRGTARHGASRTCPATTRSCSACPRAVASDRGNSRQRGGIIERCSRRALLLSDTEALPRPQSSAPACASSPTTWWTGSSPVANSWNCCRHRARRRCRSTWCIRPGAWSPGATAGRPRRPRRAAQPPRYGISRRRPAGTRLKAGCRCMRRVPAGGACHARDLMDRGAALIRAARQPEHLVDPSAPTAEHAWRHHHSIDLGRPQQ